MSSRLGTKNWPSYGPFKAERIRYGECDDNGWRHWHETVKDQDRLANLAWMRLEGELGYSMLPYGVTPDGRRRSPWG